VPSVWGLVARHDRAAVGGNDTLAAASALEPHRDADDQCLAVERGLDALSRTAFLSTCFRSSLWARNVR
jgi:hypothetical protein